MSRYTRFITVIAAVVAGGNPMFIPEASASTLRWSFDTDSGQTVCVDVSDDACGSGWKSSIVFGEVSGLAGNVTTSGWANTKKSGAGSDGSFQQQGDVQRFTGGLGVRNVDEITAGDPGGDSDTQASVDNDDRYDWVLMDFGTQDVALNGVTIGASQFTTGNPPGGSDMTVLYFDGVGNPGSSSDVVSLANDKTFDDLLLDGWALVDNQHFSNVGASDGMGGSVSFNSSLTQVSSHWLLGAYNDRIASAGLSTNDDSVFIESVTAGTPSVSVVPVPATLGLFALGVGLVAGASRISQRRKTR